jgi:Protein of unknown function (DUF3006)
MSVPVCDVAVSEVVIIDRIVEDLVVVEWSPDCLMDVPRAWLPADVREGDRLFLRFRRAPPVSPIPLGGDRPPTARRTALRVASPSHRSNRSEDDNAHG